MSWMDLAGISSSGFHILTVNPEEDFENETTFVASHLSFYPLPYSPAETLFNADRFLKTKTQTKIS